VTEATPMPEHIQTLSIMPRLIEHAKNKEKRILSMPKNAISQE
jgi:hypothetical protein